jgi:hypothetical protein
VRGGFAYGFVPEPVTRSVQFDPGPGVPLWARQMEIFILEDMNQLEAAKVLLGGLLQSGKIDDPAEARFLAQRLHELDARLAGRK